MKNSLLCRLEPTSLIYKMKKSESQQLIEDIFLQKDKNRSWQDNYIWLVEEVGELSRAVRSKNSDNMEEEFADVYAWLLSLASILDINLDEVLQKKYGNGCPKCAKTPCGCRHREEEKE